MNKLKQSEITKLIIKLNEKKDYLQAEFEAGRMQLKDVCDEYGIAASTARTILDSIGIKRGRTPRQSKVPSDAILKVLHRICVQLDIKHEEIKPFLNL